MKRFSYLDEQDLHDTRAFKIHERQGVDPTLKFMRLMDHARDSLIQSPTVPRDLFNAPEQNFDMQAELAANKEFHAAIDLTRKMLKDVHVEIL